MLTTLANGLGIKTQLVVIYVNSFELYKKKTITYIKFGSKLAKRNNFILKRVITFLKLKTANIDYETKLKFEHVYNIYLSSLYSTPNLYFMFFCFNFFNYVMISRLRTPSNLQTK